MSDMSEFRGVHDLGGLCDEPFVRSEHNYAPWEKRVHAIRELLAAKKLLRVDELRRTIEGLGDQRYLRWGYYETWVWAISQVLLDKGIFTDAEFGGKLAEVAARYRKQNS